MRAAWRTRAAEASEPRYGRTEAARAASTLRAKHPSDEVDGWPLPGSDSLDQRAGVVGRLDSLFIDEGFGTLDSDTLALVADAIQGLRVGGRMVGIITHIPELRDELTQHIVVTKHQGFSTVKVHAGTSAPLRQAETVAQAGL